jgi:hypothetical protein
MEIFDDPKVVVEHCAANGAHQQRRIVVLFAVHQDFRTKARGLQNPRIAC